MTHPHIPEEMREKMRESDRRGLRGCLILISMAALLCGLFAWFVFK